MTMESKDATLLQEEACGNTSPNSSTSSSAKPTTIDLGPSMQFEWSEELAARFVCRLCNKTFYNAVALQNHRTQQHDLEGSTGSEVELPLPIAMTFDQSIDGMCAFKFVPLKRENSLLGHISQKESGEITPHTFTEDTTYLVIKVAPDDVDTEPAKKKRLEGAAKRTQLKEGKQPIDLRGPFTCTFPSAVRPNYQCRQIFFNCCEYSLHYREEHTKRRKAALRCQVCEKRLDRDFPTTPLDAQLQAANCTFSCRICGQTFFESSEYDEHNRTYHAKTKPHQCTICFKRFTQQGGLQQHLRMHTGIRPFACTFCSKAFTQKAGLDQHLRTHTKVKPFKCVICTKCFSQSVHLRQHMRTHTNIQPFECSVCGRRFKQTSHLNFHMKSHGALAAAASRSSEPAAAETVTEPEEAEVPSVQTNMAFMNLSNLQAVGDGDTLYYAADLVPSNSGTYNFQATQIALPKHVLSL